MRLYLVSFFLFVCAHVFANVIDIKSVDQFKTEMAKEGPRVVLYTAEWCPGCKAFHPIYEKVSNDMSVRFYQIDVDNKNLKSFLETLSIPYVPFVTVAPDEGKFWISPCSAAPYKSVEDEKAAILKCITEGL